MRLKFTTKVNLVVMLTKSLENIKLKDFGKSKSLFLSRNFSYNLSKKIIMRYDIFSDSVFHSFKLVIQE